MYKIHKAHHYRTSSVADYGQNVHSIGEESQKYSTANLVLLDI